MATRFPQSTVRTARSPAPAPAAASAPCWCPHVLSIPDTAHHAPQVSRHPPAQEHCFKKKRCQEAPSSAGLSLGTRLAVISKTAGSRPGITLAHTHAHTLGHTLWLTGTCPGVAGTKASGREVAVVPPGSASWACSHPAPRVGGRRPTTRCLQAHRCTHTTAAGS